MASAARRTLALLSLLGAAGALRPCTRATRLSVTRPSHRRSVVRLVDEEESLTDAFANFVKQSKPKKPGEGAPSRTDVRGLPIGKGGTVRDTSLGSFRAALQNWEVLKDPRNWEAEEFGLVGGLGLIVAAIAFFYFTYVSPAEMVASRASAPTVSPSAATISPRVPAAGAGTSTVTLSVSSSHSISSCATESPGFLNQVATVASDTMCDTMWLRVVDRRNEAAAAAADKNFRV